MSELEEKLSAVLSNPQLMQQIMSMAKAMGGPQSQPQPEPPKPPEPPAAVPGLDPKLLQGIAALSRQGGIDSNQRALLKALSPYLSRDRVAKLERAMGAARMAGAASAFLNAGGLQILGGR